MTMPNVSDDAPGAVLFPEFDTLYDLVAREVEGLTEAQLDFHSDQWKWAKWSIRTQVSHMAFAMYGWLLRRWGDTLFPNGEHGIEDVAGVTTSGSDRRLDEQRYWDLPVLLQKLQEAIALAQKVLAQRSIGFLRSHTYARDFVDHWQLMAQAHPTGVSRPDARGKFTLTLEATFRHINFEEITHLYTIQRLKRAQGLPTVVEVSRVGYWVLEGWDRSEA